MTFRVLGAVWALTAGLAATAHDARPVFVQVSDHGDGSVRVEWRVPTPSLVPVEPDVVLDSAYVRTGETVRAHLDDATVFTAAFAGPDTVAGRTISIRYPTVNPGFFTLIRVTQADGTVHSELLPPDQTEWRVPTEPGRWTVFTGYTALGVRHIFEGIDHLLFVACLVLLAGTLKRTLLTVTGFTLAHSVTLALATLDVVDVPAPPVEAVIALSVLFAARELAVPDRDSLIKRYPVAVSSSFGLLHGFGFASALRETGLPPGEVPTALLSFNIGVELGQIAFVTVVWSGIVLASVVKAKPALTSAIRQPAVYAIGTIAAYWTLSRVAAIWIA